MSNLHSKLRPGPDTKIKKDALVNLRQKFSLEKKNKINFLHGNIGIYYRAFYVCPKNYIM